MGAKPQIIHANMMDKIPTVEEFKLIHLNKWIADTEKYAWDKLINNLGN